MGQSIIFLSLPIPILCENNIFQGFPPAKVKIDFLPNCVKSTSNSIQ